MIRLANEQDTSQIRELWSYCFDDTPEFVDFYFKTCYQADNTLVAEEDGRIQSCLQILPYSMFLRDREIPISYIVGVATWPEFRGRGLVRKLLQFTDEVLQERGIYQSILLPFQYDFYRKYGWEVCYDFLTYKNLEFSSFYSLLRPMNRKPAHANFVKVNLDEDFTKINQCYNQYMKRFHGYLLRGKNEWNKIIHDVKLHGGACYVYEEKGQPLGYIIYIIHDKRLEIIELANITFEAKSSLLNLALSHIGQVDQISRKANSWDMDYLFMTDSRGKIEKETFVMARIHNIIKALSGLAYSGDSFVLSVNDDFYYRNNGNFMISQKQGVTYVEKTKQEADGLLDIRTLNQLLWAIYPRKMPSKRGEYS